MKTVIGIESLKNEFRKAKLQCGDLRGLKNKFPLSRELGVAQLSTFYFSMGGNGEKRVELTADCYPTKGKGSVHVYSMGDLVKEMKNEKLTFHVHLICLLWDKKRLNADRKQVTEFYYKNK